MVARPRHDDERLVDVVVHNCRNRASLLRMPHLPRRASAARYPPRRPGAAAARAAVRPRAPLGGALRTAQRRQPGAARQRLTTASLHLHDPLAAQAVLALVGAAVQGKRLLPL